MLASSNLTGKLNLKKKENDIDNIELQCHADNINDSSFDVTL